MEIDYRKRKNGTTQTFQVLLIKKAQQNLPDIIKNNHEIEVKINPKTIAISYEGEIIGEILDKQEQQKILHILSKTENFLAVISSVKSHIAALEISYPREILQFTDELYINVGNQPITKYKSFFDDDLQYVYYYVNKKEQENFIFFGKKKKMLKVIFEHGHLVAQTMFTFNGDEKSNDEEKIINAKVFQMKLSFYQGDLSNVPPDHQFVSISSFRNFFEKNIENTYLQQWNLYKQFELDFIENQASQCQELTYTAYEVQSDYIRFQLLGKPDISGWIHAGNSFAVNLEADSINKRHEKILLGSVRRITTNFIDIEYDVHDDLFTQIELPKKGTLSVSTLASEVATKRRDTAIEKIKTRESVIPNLGDILNNPELVNPIQFYEYSFPNPKQPTLVNNYPADSNQVRAIMSALNTSDLVLIQGPPGTGKTSIIQTIIRCLIDLGQENILLTSYQHLAVNNALSGLADANILSHRFGDKSKQYELTKSYIVQIDEIVKQVPMPTQTARTDVSKTEELRDILYSYKNKELTEEDCKFLEKYILESMKSNSISISVLKKCFDIIPKLRLTTVVEENSSESKLLLKPSYAHFIEHEQEWKREVDAFEKQASTSTTKLKVKSLWRDITSSSKRLKILANSSKTSFEKKLEQLLHLLESNLTKVISITVDQLRINDAMDSALMEIEKDLLARQEKLEDNQQIILKEWIQQLQNDYSGFIKVVSQYAEVKGVTCQQTFAFKHGLFDTIYDAVIIDEAARANPLDLLIPMTLGKKIILVGDHKQLPHILEPSFAEEVDEGIDFEEIYEKSLFERLFSQLPNSKCITLTTQFRMHEKISNLVGELFYDSQLKAGMNPQSLLNDTGMYNQQNLVWMNVPYKKDFIHEREHYENEKEADVLIEQVKQMREQTSHSIGIITFYNHQLSLLKRKLEHAGLSEFVEVGTVDAFQGKEKDIIFLSTVRSNHYKESSKALGFLRSPNRLNVALSRAKRLLVIVGDATTLVKDPLFARIYEYIKENGYVSEYNENKTQQTLQ